MSRIAVNGTHLRAMRHH